MWGILRVWVPSSGWWGTHTRSGRVPRQPRAVSAPSPEPEWTLYPCPCWLSALTSADPRRRSHVPVMLNCSASLLWNALYNSMYINETPWSHPSGIRHVLFILTQFEKIRYAKQRRLRSCCVWRIILRNDKFWIFSSNFLLLKNNKLRYINIILDCVSFAIPTKLEQKQNIGNWETTQ